MTGMAVYDCGGNEKNFPINIIGNMHKFLHSRKRTENGMMIGNTDLNGKSIYDHAIGRTSPPQNERRSRRAARQALISNIAFGAAFLFVASLVLGLLH